MFVYQHQVFLRRRFLLAAGMLLVQGGLLGALAAALRPIQGDMGGALQHEGAGGARARVACRRPSQIGEGALQDGPPVMPPMAISPGRDNPLEFRFGAEYKVVQAVRLTGSVSVGL